MTKIPTCPSCAYPLKPSGLKREIIDGEERRYKVWRCMNQKCKKYNVPRFHPIFKEIELNQDKRRLEENGNEAIAVINTQGKPLTIEEMLIIFKVDTDIWEVDHHTINSWGVTSWKKGTPEQRTNFQTKVFLIRRVPVEQEFPALKKVSIKTPHKRRKERTKPPSACKKAMVISDIHCGYSRDMMTGQLKEFHDRRALDIELHIAETEQPDVIYFCGDLLDMAEWSDKFIKSGEYYFTFQPALIELYWWLTRFRKACPSARIIYIEGNHESRLTRSTLTNLLAAYQIKPANAPKDPPALGIENLMSLKSLDIEYAGDYPKNNLWINDNLSIWHSNIVRAGSGDTVKAILKDTRHSMIVGHGHRREYANKTVHPRGRTIFYTVFMVGCSCHIDGRVPSNTNKENWQQGCAMVEYTAGNGPFDIKDIPINEGIALYKGRIIKGNGNIVDQLNRDTIWKF